MEARATEFMWKCDHENESGHRICISCLADYLTQVGDERYREGMEEAAKVAEKACFVERKCGMCEPCHIAAAIREKIKEGK